MIAAVLCGGMGTRLRSVIGEHQKCAVDVGGRPWLHRVLDELHKGGIREFLLLTGYQSMEINLAADAWIKSKGAVGARVTTLHSTPAGPDAAINMAFAHSDERRLLVVNGDTLVEGFPLADFLTTCERLGKTCVVRGHSWECRDRRCGTIVDAGLALVVAHRGDERSEWPANTTFLDIGSPKGLAEARRRFA